MKIGLNDLRNVKFSNGSSPWALLSTNNFVGMPKVCDEGNMVCFTLSERIRTLVPFYYLQNVVPNELCSPQDLRTYCPKV